MVLLLEVVLSAFKLPVWGGHTCGSQRVAWTVILPCFEAGSLPALSIPLELWTHATTPGFYVGEES